MEKVGQGVNVSQSIPLVAIIGRPNVGKSTLFNRIVGRRKAITFATPGVTRDLNYEEASWDGITFNLIDTGGLEFKAHGSLERDISTQVLGVLKGVDCLILLMDGRAGVTALDRDWVTNLRKIDKPKIFAINKVDSEALMTTLTDFYELGITDPTPVSAETGRGVSDLLDSLKSILHSRGSIAQLRERDEEGSINPLRLVIIGRPNAGKSTLLNRLAGAPRALVHEEPGTTRDPVTTSVAYQGRIFDLFDTAGIRRRGRVGKVLEKVAVSMALEAIRVSDLCLLVMDATDRVSAQDLHVAGEAFKLGKAVIILVNKWDATAGKTDVRLWNDEIKRRFRHMESTPVLYISAKTGNNVGKILPLILKMEVQLLRRIPESELLSVLEEIVAGLPTPVFRGRNIKILGGHQLGVRPPTFVIYTDQPSKVHFSYKRHLVRSIREAFGFRDIPVTIKFRRRER